jgi:hypothetical protein
MRRKQLHLLRRARPDGGQAGFLNGLEQTSIALKHLFSRPVSNFKPTKLFTSSWHPSPDKGRDAVAITL